MKKRLTAFFLVLLLTACTAPDQPTISLYQAVQRGDLEQVDRHLYYAADINKAFADGRFPLHIAARYGRVVLLRLLLKHGADIAARNRDGDSALAVAILAGRTQAADVLLKAGTALDASALLLKAATRNSRDRDVLRYLLKQNANIEIRDQQGNTPLLIAILQKNSRLTHHLVDHGADVNAQDSKGHSALQIARQLQLDDIVSLLLRTGAISQ